MKMMPTTKPVLLNTMSKQRTPAYLTNLNSDPDDILLDGKDYLQGLPLRRRKRKRPDDDDIGPPQTSLFHKITNNTASQFRFGDIHCRNNAIILSVILIATSAIFLLRGFGIKRRRFTERSEEVKKQCIHRKKKRRKKVKKTEKNPMNDLPDCKQANSDDESGSGKRHKLCLKQTNKEHSGGGSLLKEGVQIVTPCHHKVEITPSQESQTITSRQTRGRHSNDMHKDAALTVTHSSNQNAVDIHHGSHNQLNSQANFPIKEIASRWELLGLGRQKSLELAANAEMNWYFYQDIKQSFTSAAIHCFDQLGWHTLQILTQSEKLHRERLDAPAMDMLRKRRQEVKLSLLNTQLLCRCLFLALAARFVRRDNNLASLSSAAFSTFLSNLCPECNTTIIRDTMSNFLYYDLDSWRNVAYNLMESMSSAWYCFGRLIFCTVCLGILHCVSRKLTYALLASTLIPWREIMNTGIVIVATNCLLTFSMLKRCSNFDLGLEQTGGDAVKIDPREATDMYNRQINIYRAMSYFISVCTGLFGIDASFEHVVKSAI